MRRLFVREYVIASGGADPRDRRILADELVAFYDAYRLIARGLSATAPQ